MAPSTRPQRERSVHNDLDMATDGFVADDFLNDVDLPIGDPWGVPNQEIEAAPGILAGNFEDSFVQNSASAASSTENLINYESNVEYLTYLESKLNRVESRRRNVEKLTASEVLNSLKDVKEIHLNWNMQQGLATSEDDTIETDTNGPSGYLLPKEIRRKMFPEQDAINETELLNLLEHDVIEKMFCPLETSSNDEQ